MENSSNFNASELEIVNSALRLMQAAYSELLFAGRGGAENPYLVSNIIKSEDSNLAETWRGSSDISTEIYNKSRDLAAKIMIEIQRYVKSTIENESTTAETVASVNSSLESSKEALAQLDF